MNDESWKNAEIEISRKIKKLLLDDFNCNNRKGLYSLTQKMMAYNSNKIEGSTLTYEQTATLFDTGTFTSNGVEVYRAKDIEETNGHFKMFSQMIKFIDKPLSIDLIKSYHYQFKSGVFEDMANGYPIGEFKNRANTVNDIVTAKPSDVNDEMTKLLDSYNRSDKILFNIAVFHAKYENIHPFQDGNGRTGRLIMFKQCLDNELVPVIIKDDDREFYVKALHEAQVEQNYTNLVELFEKCQDKYYNEINIFLEDDYVVDNTINKNPYITKEDVVPKI